MCWRLELSVRSPGRSRKCFLKCHRAPVIIWENYRPLALITLDKKQKLFLDSAIVFQMKLNCTWKGKEKRLFVISLSVGARTSRSSKQISLAIELSELASGGGKCAAEDSRHSKDVDNRRRLTKWNWKVFFLINLCKFRDESRALDADDDNYASYCLLFINRH